MLYGLTAPGLKLYVLRDLHAKVYISEKHALVTALNLLESSFNNSCIRCGDELELDPDKPYCSEHYAVWARYSNPDYKDNFCHGCGDDYSATKNKPFCRDCFNQYRDRDDGIAF